MGADPASHGRLCGFRFMIHHCLFTLGMVRDEMQLVHHLSTGDGWCAGEFLAINWAVLPGDGVANVVSSD